MSAAAMRVAAVPRPSRSGGGRALVVGAVFEPVGECEEGGGQRAGDEPGGKHPHGEGCTVDRVVSEHEQVGQVRAGQQERGGVGHEDRAVEERSLVKLAPARGVHQHRRQEHDRGVQVEHRGHDGDEGEQRHKKRAWPERRRASRVPIASNSPSAAATAPIRRSPATSTKGGHACAVAATILWKSILNSKSNLTNATATTSRPGAAKRPRRSSARRRWSAAGSSGSWRGTSRR